MSTPRFARGRFGARRVSNSKTLGVLVAVLAMASVTAVAVAAGSTTLATGKAAVKSKTKTVVVNSSGVTLYTLSGESASHLECVSSACFKAWPPYKVSATAKLTKAKGMTGTLSKLHRVKSKFYQVMLNGHPLYTFVLDSSKMGLAKGEGVTAFGGTWHVVSP
jgi:predicted lipoprotein with Yx(FWY)xxD motif